MKILPLLLLSFSIESRLWAQTQSYDLATFTPPGKEWKKEIAVGMLTYTFIDQKTKTWAKIAIYQHIAGNGNLLRDFEEDWQQLTASRNTMISGPDKLPAKTVGGWSFITANGKARFNTADMLIQHTVYSNASSRISVLAQTNDARYISDFEKFRHSLLLKSESNPTQANTTISTRENEKQNVQWMSGLPGDSLSFTGPGAEVWMNFQYSGNRNPFIDPVGVGKLKPKFYVLYSNGDYYPYLPVSGLANFSNKKKENESWGIFKMKGNSGSFRSKYEQIEVQRISPTKMKKKGYSFDFYKCVSVDGLKLDGQWATAPDWAQHANFSKQGINGSGVRAVIQFNRDGTFQDFGAFVTNLLMPNQYPENAPGKGRYHINNFTLRMQYSDGRIVYKALTGIGDQNPAVKDAIIYIGTQPFYKGNSK